MIPADCPSHRRKRTLEKDPPDCAQQPKRDSAPVCAPGAIHLFTPVWSFSFPTAPGFLPAHPDWRGPIIQASWIQHPRKEKKVTRATAQLAERVTGLRSRDKIIRTTPDTEAAEERRAANVACALGKPGPQDSCCMMWRGGRRLCILEPPSPNCDGAHRIRHIDSELWAGGIDGGKACLCVSQVSLWVRFPQNNTNPNDGCSETAPDQDGPPQNAPVFCSWRFGAGGVPRLMCMATSPAGVLRGSRGWSGQTAQV